MQELENAHRAKDQEIGYINLASRLPSCASPLLHASPASPPPPPFNRLLLLTPAPDPTPPDPRITRPPTPSEPRIPSPLPQSDRISPRFRVPIVFFLVYFGARVVWLIVAMEMTDARAAATGDVRTEDKEMDLLLSEIPHVTSPQHQQRAVIAGGGVIAHGNGVDGSAGASLGYAAQRYGGEDAYFAVATNRRDDGDQLQGGGFHAPLSMGVGAAPLPASGPFFGGVPSPLAQAAEDPEQQWLANQLRGLHIVDTPAAQARATLQRHSPRPPVKYAAAPEDVPAVHNPYYGYSFEAPGTSVHHEHLFLDQTKAFGCVAAPPQHFVSDVGFDGRYGFSRGLDSRIGGLVYNRVVNGTGIGWGQGLVHPDPAESYVLSGPPAGAQHNWEFLSPSPIALDARGGTKRHYAYGVPAADTGFARGGFNQFEPFRRENGLMLDGMKNISFRGCGRDWKLQQYVNTRAYEPGNSKALRYENMVGVKGYIYFMAKDQNGCRFLQRKLEQGEKHVDAIFEGIIDHIAELMTNSFANYLVQKMLDVCDEEQRLRIIAVLTEDPVLLLRISLNTHG
jgi:hypothetical protein